MSPTFLHISFSLSFSVFYVFFVSTLLHLQVSSGNDLSIIKSNLSIVHDVSSFQSLFMSTPFQYLARHAAYYTLPDTDGARMFYYFFEKRSAADSPVMLWLTGVAGLSCSIALFRENGPFHIEEDFSLEWNEHGWDKGAKMIYVDEPFGTGYSYADKIDQIRRDRSHVVDDLYKFLVMFFQRHPHLKENDFFITGQSYAGLYAPALAMRIYRENEANPKLGIKLKGVAMGNAFINPRRQYESLPSYSENLNLIDKNDRPRIDEFSETCQTSIETCDENSVHSDCIKAYNDCEILVEEIYKIKKRNIYDFRKEKVGDLNYDFSHVKKFLNTESVKKALHVGNKSFDLMNNETFEAMKGDYMKNAEENVAALLNTSSINVLIYAGETDLLCNFDGNYYSMRNLRWEVNYRFEIKELVPFIVDDVTAGRWGTYGPLTFLRVSKAGHMVAMDQPKVAFEMMRIWIQHALKTRDN